MNTQEIGKASITAFKDILNDPELNKRSMNERLSKSNESKSSNNAPKSNSSEADLSNNDDQKTVFNRKEALRYLKKFMKIGMTNFYEKVQKGIIKTSPDSSRYYLKKDLDEYLGNPR